MTVLSWCCSCLCCRFVRRLAFLFAVARDDAEISDGMTGSVQADADAAWRLDGMHSVDVIRLACADCRMSRLQSLSSRSGRGLHQAMWSNRLGRRAWSGLCRGGVGDDGDVGDSLRVRFVRSLRASSRRPAGRPRFPNANRHHDWQVDRTRTYAWA